MNDNSQRPNKKANHFLQHLQLLLMAFHLSSNWVTRECSCWFYICPQASMAYNAMWSSVFIKLLSLQARLLSLICPPPEPRGTYCRFLRGTCRHQLFEGNAWLLVELHRVTHLLIIYCNLISLICSIKNIEMNLVVSMSLLLLYERTMTNHKSLVMSKDCLPCLNVAISIDGRRLKWQHEFWHKRKVHI